MIVKRKVFINAKDEEVNDFLSKIPAENVLSTHFAVYGHQEASDEWTAIFYKVEEAPQS